MEKQKRGCSRLVYAPYIYTPAQGQTPASITFGTVKPFAVVKSITKTVEGATEAVYGDNKLQYQNGGANVATRDFEVIAVSKEVEAEVLGQSVLAIGTRKFTGTAEDVSEKPYFAFGYALHDGKINQPCEVVWAFKGQVNSITSVANTMAGNDTASESQTVNVTFFNPDFPWSETGKYDLDICEKITETNATDVTTWFNQVVTYDNADTIFPA